MSTSNFPVSLIALAVMQACAGAASAQTTASALPEVVVSAARADTANRASVAGFGDAALLDTPASVSVLTRQQMQDLRVRSTSDAMKYDASVSDAYNAVGYAEQFSIRGFALDNNSSYRKDGLAIPGDTEIPLENKERIEVLKGLAGFQAGVAAPGGVVDYVLKRPTNTALRSVTLEASERGTLYGAIDLGGRFDDKRFGYRINAAGERLRSYIKGADGNRKFVSGAFDWQLTPQALLQLDADYQYKSQVSAPGFQLINGTTLPQVAADTMLNNQPWSRPVRTESANLGLRFQYQFSPEWHATLSANQHSFKRDDYTAFPYGCGAQNLYPGYCGNGDYDVYDYQSLGERKSPLAARALLQGKFATGALRHELTLGASLFKREDKFGAYLYDYAGTSNIYQPVAVQPTGLTSGPVIEQRNENERAVFAQDILTLSEALTLHGGLRYVQVKRHELTQSAEDASPNWIGYDQGYALPNLALVYQPAPKVSLYAAYSHGLEHGGVAEIETANAGGTLSPARSKQIELGVKTEVARDLLLSAALFQIRKGLEYVDDSNYFVRNGQAQHRGMELQAQGKLNAALTLGVSVTALNTRQQGTGVANIDGKRVTDVPSFKSSVFADYVLAGMPGLKLNGSWQYAGKKAFDQENTVMVPGYHVFNLGAAYATTVGGSATILRANVDNVFDKFYWRDVTPQLGGYLLPGATRVFKVSAQFDF
ncbi:MAG: TonB-dependent siderophore receptor [Pseudomonadota bacterium]